MVRGTVDIRTFWALLGLSHIAWVWESLCVPYLVLDRDDHGDEDIVLGLCFTPDVELLYAEAQAADHRLAQVAVDAVEPGVGHARELSELRDEVYGGLVHARVTATHFRDGCSAEGLRFVSFEWQLLTWLWRSCRTPTTGKSDGRQEKVEEEKKWNSIQG